jgi:transcriptional regulator with XRE-family HTH domain
MDQMTSFGELASGLKRARANKRLSQRGLSTKISFPQSHISNIESGKVDLKTSSLIELARALDLEVMLVPRSLVPTVSALIQGSEGTSGPTPAKFGSSETETLETLVKARKQADRLAKHLSQAPEITRFSAAATALERLRLAEPQVKKINDILASVRIPQNVLRRATQAATKFDEMISKPEIQRALKKYAEAADQIRMMRNMLAHGANPSETRSIAAYRLSEGDDDA